MSINLVKTLLLVRYLSRKAQENSHRFLCFYVLCYCFYVFLASVPLGGATTNDGDHHQRKPLRLVFSRSYNPARPWGTQIAPVSRNDIVSFDHLHMGQSERGWTVVLVVTDKLTNFTRLYPMESEDAVSTADALLDWMSTFGIPRTLMSDNGSAFAGNVIKSLTQKMSIGHHFVTAYSSWSNGKQERLNLTIGNAFRALLSEHLLAATHWSAFVPLVQSIINHLPTQSLNWISPSEAFLARAPSNPVSIFRESDTPKFRTTSWESEEMKVAVTAWHKEAAEREVILYELQAQRNKDLRAKQSAKGRVKHFVGKEGDFVMVHNPKKTIGKLERRWRGPAQVVSFSDEAPDHVLTVKYLGHQGRRAAQETVHTSRVEYFDSASMTVTNELLEHAQETSTPKWDIKKILDLRAVGRRYELQIDWEGNYEPTWEPLVRLCTDVPQLVMDFIVNNVPEHSKEHLPGVHRLAAIKRLVQKGGSVTG